MLVNKLEEVEGRMGDSCKSVSRYASWPTRRVSLGRRSSVQAIRLYTGVLHATATVSAFFTRWSSGRIHGHRTKRVETSLSECGDDSLVTCVVAQLFWEWESQNRSRCEWAGGGPPCSDMGGWRLKFERRHGTVAQGSCHNVVGVGSRLGSCVTM